MTKLELHDMLRRENVPSDYYSLEGGLPNEKWCLGKTYVGWEVYYSERGLKSSLVVFASEDEACTELYNRIKRYIG